jgi:hypothetical protein
MKPRNNKKEIKDLMDNVLSDLVNAKKDWQTFLPIFRQIIKDASKTLKVEKKNFDFFNELILAMLKRNKILHTKMFDRLYPNLETKKLGDQEIVNNLVEKVLRAGHNAIEINLREFFVICDFFLNGKVTKLAFYEEGYLFRNKDIELVCFEKFDHKLFELHYDLHKQNSVSNETR